MAKLEKQWKYSWVERQLIKAWLEGEKADFGEIAPDPADRPEVSGAFLVQLWLGKFGHPRDASPRLLLRGLRITGRFAVSDVREDFAGRDALALLRAEDCVFEAPFRVIMCRTQSMTLVRCNFSGDRDGTAAVNLDSTQIEGDLEFRDCAVDGMVLAESTSVTTTVAIRGVRCSEGLSLMGMTCGGHIHIDKGHFAGEAGLKLDRMSATTRCFVWDSTIAGNFWLRWVKTGTVQINGCKVLANTRGPGSLNFTGLKAGINLDIARVLVQGTVTGRDADIEGNLHISQLAVTGSAHDSGNIDLQNSRVGKDLTVMTAVCRRGILGLIDCKIGDRLLIARVKAAIIKASRIQARVATVADSRVATNIDMPEACVSGILCISNTSVGIPAGGQASWSSIAESTGEIVLTSTRAAIALHIYDCAIGRLLDLSHCRVGQTVITRVVVLATHAQANITMESLQAEGLVSLATIACGRINCATMACDMFHIGGAQVGAREVAEGGPASFQAHEIVVHRNVCFHGNDQCGYNRIVGQILLAGARIDGDLVIYEGCYGFVPGLDLPTSNSAIALHKAQVGGIVAIGCVVGPDGPTANSSDEDPLVISGCVSLDNCGIAGDLLLRSGVLAHFESAGSVDDDDIDGLAVKRNKATIALSLQNARIDGTLSVDAVTLDGRVDLRECHVGRISDKATSAWTTAGLGQGELLLDGLTYDDLDHLERQRPGGSGQRLADVLLGQAGSDEARSRLDWIARSFPAHDAGFAPQPYEQLAHYFAQDGDERSRRHVLVAKRERQRRYGGLGLFERGLSWLLKATSNYGYSPARAMLWLLGYFALGTLFAWLLASAGAIQPNSADLVSPFPYNYFVLAVDAAIPIIDLDHDAMLTIVPAALPWWASEDGVLVGKALYEIVGMLLLSITVLTLTGTLRERE